MEAPVVAGVAFNRDEAQITVTGLPDTPGTAYGILKPVSDANIEIDMIVLATSRSGGSWRHCSRRTSQQGVFCLAPGGRRRRQRTESLRASARGSVLTGFCR